MSKNLVYLKLFEAFESIKLSKTLKFIDKDSKSRFMDILRSIANGMDLPYSKYSDDYFQYLPFNRALSLNQRLEDEPCENTSMSQFGNQHGIEGEKCESGRIKRKWGRGNRIVACDVCKGSGIKPKKFTKIKWIKFWFNKDGNFINVTGTDGNIRGQVKTLTSALETVPNYENLKGIPDEGELTIVKDLSHAELSSLPNGSIVSIRIDGVQLIGRLYKYGRNIYIIQNRKQGSEPGDRAWKEYGRVSWVVTSGEYSGTPKLMVLTKDTSEEDKVDPYSWNAPLNTRNISLDKNSNVKEFLKNAHFAIVLDVLELSKSGFKKKSEIEQERSYSKSGATKLISDDEIKSMNISRYMSEISKNIEISDDFKKFDKTLFRYFGYSKIGYFTLRERYFGDFETLLNRVYDFIRTDNMEIKESLKNQIIDEIRNTLEKNSIFGSNVDSAIRNTKLKSDDHKRILDKVEELNLAIYNKLRSIKIETFDDVEVFFAKMKMIRSNWRNSDRLHVRNIYYLIERVSDEAYVNKYCQEIITSNDIDNILSKTDKFIRLIERI